MGFGCIRWRIQSRVPWLIVTKSERVMSFLRSTFLSAPIIPKLRPLLSPVDELEDLEDELRGEVYTVRYQQFLSV